MRVSALPTRSALPKGALLLLVFASFVLTACGSKTPAAEVPKTHAHPPAGLDDVRHPSAWAFVRLDLKALRQSPHYPVLSSWLLEALTADRPNEARERQAFQTALDRSDLAMLSLLTPAQGSVQASEFLLALRGTFGPHDLESFLQEVHVAANPGTSSTVQKEIRHGQRVYVSGDLAGLETQGAGWILGSTARLDEVLNPAQAKRAFPPRLERAIRALDVDRAEMGAALEVRPELAAQLELLRRVGVDVQRPEAMAMRGRLQNDFEARVDAFYPDAAQAAAVAQNVQARISKLSGSVIVLALGLSPILRSLRLSSEQERAVLQIQMDEQEAKRLVERLRTLVPAAINGQLRSSSERGLQVPFSLLPLLGRSLVVENPS